MFVVLEDLVGLVPSWDQVSFLLPKKCSIKGYLLLANLAFVAVEYKTVFLCYFHKL